jgi:predicted TIM-barrel fold metal-dependent hydrolase
MIDYAILDSHLHLWDTTKISYSWITGKLVKQFLAENFVEQTKGINIDGVVLVEAACDSWKGFDLIDYVVGNLIGNF